MDKLSKDEKTAELAKYRDLVLATIDYYIDYQILGIKATVFDKEFEIMKLRSLEDFQKGRLTRLKQGFRDLTEMIVEGGDLRFNQYIQDKTHYNIDIFKSYFQRVDKIIENGKIKTDNQFYDINSMVDRLCQSQPVDDKKIEILNKLLAEYEQRKDRQVKRKG